MKDFCKWLGVNEKIAKIVVWIFIFFVSLIIVNTAFESLGLTYYKITVDNISKINGNKIFDYVSSWIIALLNFYSIIFLVFRVKDFKKIFKYSIIFLILDILINKIFGAAFTQLFIIVYILSFCYFYSKKNWKYVLFGIGSILLNFIIQYVCYLYKVKFIEYSVLTRTTRLLLGLDYFIIMGVIIFIKEILLKRKGK